MGKTSKFSPKIAKVTAASALMLVGMSFSPVTAGLLGAAPAFGEEVAAEAPERAETVAAETAAGQDAQEAASAADASDAEATCAEEAATDDAGDNEAATAAEEAKSVDDAADAEGEATPSAEATPATVAATTTVQETQPAAKTTASGLQYGQIVSAFGEPDSVTTYVGQQPELPATAKVQWYDGTTLTWTEGVPVTWDAIDTAALAQEGQITVKGTVKIPESSEAYANAICTVYVEQLPEIDWDDDNAIESVSVTTPAGMWPSMPKTIKVKRVDGSVTEHNVTWDTGAIRQVIKTPGVYAGYDGIYGETYAPDGDEFGVWATLTVTDPVILAATPTPGTVYTWIGHKPELPTEASVIWSDGTKTIESGIVWDELTPDVYGTANDQIGQHRGITLSGTLTAANGQTHAVSCHIVTQTNADPDYDSDTVVEDPAIVTMVGVDPTGKLPATVKVHRIDGSVTEQKVTWDAVDPDILNTPGVYEGCVYGDIETPNYFDMLGAYATIEVVPYGIESAEGVDVQTTAGTAPVLPDQVLVTWNDGTQTLEDVMWDEIDPAQYAEAGSFDVKGTVQVVDGERTATAEVACTVSVTAKEEPAQPEPEQPADTTGKEGTQESADASLKQTSASATAAAKDSAKAAAVPDTSDTAAPAGLLAAVGAILAALGVKGRKEA